MASAREALSLSRWAMTGPAERTGRNTVAPADTAYVGALSNAVGAPLR